jgi:hypothetical protein
LESLPRSNDWIALLIFDELQVLVLEIALLIGEAYRHDIDMAT